MPYIFLEAAFCERVSVSHVVDLDIALVVAVLVVRLARLLWEHLCDGYSLMVS